MRQIMNLDGKVALVTGASRGIGRAIALALAGAGARVFAGGRDEAALVAMIADNGLHDRLVPLAFDVNDSAAVKAAFMTVQKQAGRLDILVNNAGVLRDAVIEMASADLMDEVFATNLKSLVICSQYAVRLMARSGGGSIINLASIIGRFGNSGQSVYGASKAGVIGFTLSLAKEVAARGIRVNAIAPGYVETDMTAALPADKRDALMTRIGMGRAGQPADIAPLALFLASDGAHYITGQVIGVDGGLII